MLIKIFSILEAHIHIACTLMSIFCPTAKSFAIWKYQQQTVMTLAAAAYVIHMWQYQ